MVGPPLDADEDGLIEVSTLEQLNAIRYDLDGNGEDTTNEVAYSAAFGARVPVGIIRGYELMNDLDFKNGSTNTANFSIWAEGSTASEPVEEGWEPIGYFNTFRDNSSFSAIFEGNGHTISNLYIKRAFTDYVSLFGYVGGSTAALRNLGMVDVKVTGSGLVGGLVGWHYQGTVSNSYATGAVTGTGDNVGGLVGRVTTGTVSNSYATGAVTGRGDNVGGLVGDNTQGTVSNSYATGAVMGTGDNVGGLVGENDTDGTVSNSYATGSVTGNSYVGGLVGYSSVSTVSNSYATGSVTGTGDNVGGLLGSKNAGTVSNSYATGAVSGAGNVGGLVGSKSGGTITASYYNSEITGQDDTGGKGEPKTTAELQTPTGYTGIYETWDDGPDGTGGNEDDTDDWDFGTNGQYPVLKLDAAMLTVSDAPTNLRATAVSATQIDLTWEAPSDGGSPITGYDLEYSEDGNEPWADLTTSVTTIAFSDNTGLTAGTTRHYRVAAINNVGTGASSEEASATTHDVPVAPTSLTATAVSATEIDLTWDAPSDGGSTITGYDLEYSEDGSDPWKALTTSSTMTTFSDNTDLTRGTTRHYRVAAINRVGTGASSEEVSATTHDVPNAPKNLTATPGEAQVTLSWEVPANGGKAITHYAIKIADTRVALESSGAVQVAVTEVTGGDGSAGTNVNYVVTMTGVDSGTPLVNNTEYFFQVAAVNSVDTGEYSASDSATPGTSASPAVPASLTVTPGDAKMTLSWVVPANGGEPITHYAIKIEDTKEDLGSFVGVQVAVADLTGDVTSVGASVSYIVTVTGVNSGTALVNGTTYFFQIAAVNSIGTGNYTATIDATTTVPDAPTNLRATAVSATEISLSWDAPSENGGSAITGYDLEYSEDGSAPWMDLTTSGTTTSFSDNTGLTAGSTRHYRVAAINNVGTGEYSTTTAATLVVPGTPTNLTAAVVSETQIDLSWDAPSEDGGDAITGYDLEYSEDGNEPWTDLTTSVTTTSFDDTGLTAGSTRHYRVAAINAVGTGAYSEEVSATAGSPVLLSVPLEVEDSPGVYPNPGSDKVYVNLPNGNGAYVVRLHTLTGKVVLQKQLQGGSTRTLSLSKLQDGVYILNLQKDGQSNSYRLIKATH